MPVKDRPGKSRNQPTLRYNDDRPKEFISFMSLGKTQAQYYSKIDICEQTFFNWIGIYPEFSEAHRIGKIKAQAWWDDYFDINLDSPEFNVAAFKIRYERQFGKAKIYLPELSDAETYSSKSDAVINAISNGSLSPDDGIKLSHVIANLAKVEEITDLKKRVDEIEAALV